MKTNKIEKLVSTLAQSEIAFSEATVKYRNAQVAFKRAEQTLETSESEYLERKAAFAHAVNDFNSKSKVQSLDTL